MVLTAHRIKNNLGTHKARTSHVFLRHAKVASSDGLSIGQLSEDGIFVTRIEF
jgi:hypothetical protein